MPEAGQVELREAQASSRDEERAQKIYQEATPLGSRLVSWVKTTESLMADG